MLSDNLTDQLTGLNIDTEGKSLTEIRYAIEREYNSAANPESIQDNYTAYRNTIEVYSLFMEEFNCIIDNPVN